MSKIVVDSIQKSGGVAMTFPIADGAAGDVMKTDGAGTMSFETIQDNIVPADTDLIIGSVVSNSARQNVYSTGEWTSSGPWTTYYHSWQDANSIVQGWNMFMGDGYPNGTSQSMHVNDGENAMTRTKEYSHGKRIGNQNKDYFYYDNSTGAYSGVTWRCIPVRNTTDSDITRTFNAYLSSYDASYGGCSIFYYTPTYSSGTNYANATGGGWTSIFSGGSNTPSASHGGSVTIPAGQTILLFTNSIHQYSTTYRFKDSNMPYGLDTFFGTGVICDLRMLETLASARIADATQTSGLPWKIYPHCATIYGDR